MKRTRKMLSLVTLVIFTTVLVCNGLPALAAKKASGTTIVWKRGKDTTGADKAIIAAFQKKYPDITVKVDELPATSSEQHNSYTTAFSAGDDSFDVVTMDVVWANEFASSGWLLPLDNYFTAAKQKEFFPGTLKSLFYKGKYYGVPAWTDAGIFFYRKDLVKTPPKTMDQLIKISKDNIGKNGIESGYLFQAFQNEALVCNFVEFAYGNGGSIIDKYGRVALNSTKNVEAVITMQNLIKTGISPKGVVAYKPQDCIDQFKLGKTLFLRCWAFAYSQLQADNSPVKGKIGIAPIPMGRSGKESAACLGGWNLGINKFSKNTDAAWKFIDFMSSKEGQKINATVGAYMPTIKSVYTDKDVVKVFPQFPELIPILNVAKPRPLTPYYAKVSDILQINLHKALTGQAGISGSLQQAEKEINAVMSKKK